MIHEQRTAASDGRTLDPGQKDKETVLEANMGWDCCCLVAESCPTLCDPMNCSMSGSPVLHHLAEFAQTHVH